MVWALYRTRGERFLNAISVAYSTQGNHTVQLGFFKRLTYSNTTG